MIDKRSAFTIAKDQFLLQPRIQAKVIVSHQLMDAFSGVFPPLPVLRSQVTEWMSNKGELHLGKMKEDQAESLGSVIAIQKEFEKFYFTAMVGVGTGTV